MSLLDPREVAALLPAETSSLPSPIPTQFVSKVALAKAAYEREGPGRTNLRYGYVAAPAA